ncbi:Carbon monoxide dehydrogenase subunit G [Nannocystis exedens]|uniref:Carbon monoxide dehydrogenase subunit G n=1 Tax=Nannocystis exedens TaxID=54 RepID=A0A1I2D0K2_9BACT|nr:SRPBCC family protein [Nannocystis exedens]PCC68698.1 Polyketide cyclase / dehydrase and lipid transport [Nannocystis exedens]SFE74032.1 Carbon monoxide dehydrogenase subunit G [Nannocystis exedens]
MPAFHLRSDWTFLAPPERLWPLIADSPQYPRWWPGFERAEQVDDDGGVVRCRVRGDFGLTLEFVQHVVVREPPRRLEFRADGDLVGRGTWALAVHGGGTRVVMLWEVDLGRAWLRTLSRLPPVKRWMARSHHRVMEQGRRSLAALLGE